MSRRKTTEEFIAKAVGVHGNRYDYSKVVYVGAHSKVIIICKEHGDFKQTPSDHKRGRGCRTCGIIVLAGKLGITQKECIIRFKKVHGDKYIYDRVKYVNSRTKVEIGCLVKGHGYFMQRPNDHTSGYGCRKCSGTEQLTTEQCIENFKKVHGNKYIYDRVVYVLSKIKVEIGCRVADHGYFMQLPSNHKKYGCHKCAGRNRSTEEHIKDFKEIHGNTYIYDKVEYVNALTKVKIGCRVDEHGYFMQKPNDHKYGNGCPICSSSKGEKEVHRLLRSDEVDFKTQFMFAELPNRSFDFYIPGIATAIEYDGKQHYVPVNFEGKKNKEEVQQDFKDGLARDKEKNEFCKEKGITLVRIPYYENIKETLIKYGIIENED